MCSPAFQPASFQIKRRGQITNMHRDFRITCVPVMAGDDCRSRSLINRHRDSHFNAVGNRPSRAGIDKYATCLADLAQHAYVGRNDGTTTGNSLKHRQTKPFSVRAKEQPCRLQKHSGDFFIAKSPRTDEVCDPRSICQCSRWLRRPDNRDWCIRAETTPPLPNADRFQHTSEVLLPTPISEQDKTVSGQGGFGFKAPERVRDPVWNNSNTPALFWPMSSQFICGRLRNRDQGAPRRSDTRDRVVIEPLSKAVRFRLSEMNQVMNNEDLPVPDQRGSIIARNEQHIRARRAECLGKEPPIRRMGGAWAIMKFRHVEVSDHPVAIFTRDPPNSVRSNPAAVEQNTHGVNVLGNIRALLNFSCEAQ